MSELDSLLSEIAGLLAQAERDDDPARLERTLTDGYARALSLETERFRLKRRIRELASGLEDGAASEGSELRSLRRQLEVDEGSLGQLRAELSRLRQRHSLAVRAAGGE